MAGPPTLRQVRVNSGELTLGSVWRAVKEMVAELSWPDWRRVHYTLATQYVYDMSQLTIGSSTSIDVYALHHSTEVRYITSPHP